MEDVGVKAVVENTQGFLRDMKKVNTSVDGLVEKILDLGVEMADKVGSEIFTDQMLNVAGAVSNIHPAVKVAIEVLGWLWNDIKRLARDIKSVLVTAFNLAISAIKFFSKVVKTALSFALAPFKSVLGAIANSLRRVGEIASGILIANTIRKLADTIKDMASSALEAAINFQTLEVRLIGLAARQVLNEGKIEDFSTALGKAGGMAKGLLDWVIKLSLRAPISRDAIANTLTMATSYGLGAEAAKDMTKAVLDFSSGMGLSDVAMRRIIENFGQMIQQGKITSMELRDMGRGAFVPVNDLLNRTAELLGMTADEFDGTAGSINAFAAKAGLDPTMVIMEAFIALVDEEFQGAMERMGATIQGLRERFKNLTGAIFGLNVLKPALDLLGETIGRIFDKIAESDRIQIISEGIGDALKGIVENLLGEMPTVETIVDRIGDVLGKVWFALRKFQRGDIMGGLADLGVPQSFLDFLVKAQAFKEEKLIPFINNLVTAFTNLKDWWDENGSTVMEALRAAAGEILGAVGLGGKKGPPPSDRRDDPRRPSEEGKKPWYEAIQDLDVAVVVTKINELKDSILLLITKLTELKDWVIENQDFLGLLGTAFIVARYPVLSFIAFLGALMYKLIVMGGKIVTWIWEGMKTVWDESVVPWWEETAWPGLLEWIEGTAEDAPDWFNAGADIAANILLGLQDGWAKLWTWAVEQWQLLMDLFTWDNLGGMNLPTVMRPGNDYPGTYDPANAPPGHPQSSNNTTTNYNLDVEANYNLGQPPADLADDLATLLAGLV